MAKELNVAAVPPGDWQSAANRPTSWQQVAAKRRFANAGPACKI